MVALAICCLWLWVPSSCNKLLYLHCSRILEHLAEEAFSVSLAPYEPGIPETFACVREASDGCCLIRTCGSTPLVVFWLPIARHLRSEFRLIHVAGHPRDEDPIRTELRQLSDEWWPLELVDVVNTAQHVFGTMRQRSCLISAVTPLTIILCSSPSGLPVCRPATWVFTDPLMLPVATGGLLIEPSWAGLTSSYPEAEALWPLPGPSLCYLPELHGLPDPEQTTYREPIYPVYGSFNHTRKAHPFHPAAFWRGALSEP